MSDYESRYYETVSELDTATSELESADSLIESLRQQLAEAKRPDFREMREMLRAMQAGELTVSRGVEILEMWSAGNWSDDMLPLVRQDLIEEDSMPVDIIDRLSQQLAECQAALAVQPGTEALEKWLGEPVAWLDMSKLSSGGMVYATDFKATAHQTALYAKPKELK